MKYAIVGTGAIGGYYGGLLARAGRDVHFLLHSDYEYVKENGLQVMSCDGSYHLDHLNTYNDTALMPKCDVVLVCLKTTANRLLGKMLPPLMHDDTLVILIQNGIGVEGDLQRELPGVQLACGIAYICTIKTAPGTIEHMSNGRLTVGDFSCRDHKTVEDAVNDMADAGIKVKAADYLETRWKKCVWNMPFNGMTTVMDTDSVTLVNNEATGPLIYDMMREVVGAAQASGATGVGMEYADRMMDMTRHMPPYSSSMQIDHQRHHPMEIHYLYTHPIEEAKRHGFEMPRLAMLEAMLRMMND